MKAFITPIISRLGLKRAADMLDMNYIVEDLKKGKTAGKSHLFDVINQAQYIAHIQGCKTCNFCRTTDKTVKSFEANDFIGRPVHLNLCKNHYHYA